MNKIRKNILSNIIGKFWNIISTFIFVPIYLKLLGIEGYSLISFSIVIVGIMTILDAGLSASLSREFSQKGSPQNKWNVFLTLESLYFLIVIIIILLILILSGEITNNWLNLTSYSPDLVQKCIKVLGIGVAFQLLSSFYFGGLMGLELQFKANLVQILYSIIRSALLIIPLYYYPSVLLYFVWQTLSTVLYCILLRLLIRKSFPASYPAFKIGVNFDIIKKTYKFASGVFLIGLVAAINTQLDRIAISKLFPIEELGLYNLSMSIAQSILYLVIPISTALLPRFTYFVSEKNQNSVISLFSKSLKLILALSISIFSLLFFNGKNVLWIWTGNVEISNASSIFLPWLIVGTLSLAIQYIPYNVALANGYTKLNNIIGIISLFFTIPCYIIASKYLGTIGAAIVYGLVQFAVFPVYLILIRNKFLKSVNLNKMMIFDIAIPIFIGLVLSFSLSHLNFLYDNRLLELVRIVFNLLIILLFVSIIIFRIKTLNDFLKIIKNGI